MPISALKKEKKVATHEAKEMEYSIDDLKLTDNERDYLEPNYREKLTVNEYERDNWNRSALSPFRKQRKGKRICRVVEKYKI